MRKQRKTRLLPLITLILLAAPYSRTSNTGQGTQERNDRLHLIVKVISQRYCGDVVQTKAEALREKRGFARFNLRLYMRNITDRPVILCRVCLGDETPLLLPVNADGTPGNPLFDLNADASVYDPAPEFSQGPNGNYVILSPGGIYEADQETWVPVAFTTSHPLYKGYVNPGKYFLRARFSTWYQSLKETQAFQRRWESFGDLDDEVLISDPVPIEVDLPRRIPDCKYKPMRQ
jgi:hypothetical protein